jgi:hypothetical protein
MKEVLLAVETRLYTPERSLLFLHCCKEVWPGLLSYDLVSIRIFNKIALDRRRLAQRFCMERRKPLKIIGGSHGKRSIRKSHKYLILDAIVMAKMRLFTVSLQLNALRAEKHCC